MKVFFIYAHMDDETILSYGTLMHHKNDNIYVVSLCGNGRKNIRQLDREESFLTICSKLNVHKIRFPYYDLTLTKDIVDNCLSDIIKTYLPDIIYTHSFSDMHFEHRLIAQLMLLICRQNKNNSIKELYFSTSLVVNLTFGQFGNFTPNYFVNISDYIEDKRKALNLYKMELPENNNDIRSIDSIIDQNRLYGRIMNVGYCEAYQLIFKII